MDVDRRTVLVASPALLASAVSGAAGAGVDASAGRPMRRVAAEEADYPFETMPPSVDFMNRVDIPEDVRAKVFHENAERVFRIAPV